MDDLTQDERVMVISAVTFRIERLGDYKNAMTADKEKVEWADARIAKLLVINKKLEKQLEAGE